MLSVLSYNIFFGKQIKEIILWLAKSEKQFDILCFQEFPKEKIRWVKSILKPHDYAYASNTVYRGKDYGQLTVILNKKITLQNKQVILLGRNFFEEKILKLGGNRSSLLTTLQYRKKTIHLANTHLIAYALNGLRRKQLTRIIKHIEDILPKKKTTPTILVGDFNYSSLFWRKELFALLQQHEFINAHTEKTHRLFFVKQHQLDYIFYKHCIITDVQILKQPFSDHLPMVFVVQYPHGEPYL